MKKGEILECKVEKLYFPNKGRCKTAEGEDITVKNVIPGQKLSVMVSKRRGGKAEGRLLEIIEKSSDELGEPYCPHYGVCGGCSYQSLPYDRQLEIKSQMIEDLLVPVVGEDVFSGVYEGIVASPNQFSYRNKMEFSFGDAIKDGPLELGMHKRGSFYDIETVCDCQIVCEEFRRILEVTLDYFREAGIPHLHKNGEGYLRHLLVRRAEKTGEILVDLITTTQAAALGIDEESLIAGWTEAVKAAVPVKGILHTVNDAIADVVVDMGTTVLYGEDYITEELLGLKFKITPFSFFQTNSLGAEVLYSVGREFILGENERSDKAFSEVFDLYSGTGTIAQIIAPVAGHVTGVEIVEEAVEAAKINASLNGLTNCDFIAGDVLKVIDDIAQKPDYIILDPPRDGIHPKALSKIIDYGVDSMLYISCKPTSLARDLVILQEHGYEVKRVKCVDMFPGTVHVETVVLMSRKDK